MKAYIISSYFRHFADEIIGILPEAEPGSVTINNYPNREIHVVVHDEKYWIVESNALLDNQLLMLNEETRMPRRISSMMLLISCTKPVSPPKRIGRNL